MSDLIFDQEEFEPPTEELIPEEPEPEPEPEPEQEFDADEFASALWRFVRDFEKEDEDAHRNFFNEAIRSELYWNNQQHIYQRATGIEEYEWASPEDESNLYTANIYRPNGESIIAAMSASVPTVHFYPDDADNPDDVATAVAYQKIATLIQKHVNAPTLLVRILYILYNQSFVAVYNYNKKSKKFGTYQKPIFGAVEQTTETPTCPNCGALDQNPYPPSTCDTCGATYETPEIAQKTEVITQIVGYSEEPKARECIHAFGPIHVRLAPYVQELEDSPYLVLDVERHPSLGMSEYSEFKDKLNKGGQRSETDFERDYRSKLYKGEYDHLHTWKLVWVRPWAFEALESDDKLYQYLKTNFTDGIKMIFIDGLLVDVQNEALDDHWTLNRNPLSTFVNAESLGKAGISVQDATNELMNLSMDTIKHGIPQTFADSNIIDENKYKTSEMKPGNVYFTKAVPSGSHIADYIHTTRTATLSQEVDNVWDKLQQLSQLTTGAFPSIYGGVVQGSRTASEYAQSRAQALQRLSTIWTMVKELWANVISKACVSFARNLSYDEREVEKQGSGFINVWIRKIELNGKIGKVEPEPDEQMPVSWSQQRDVLMRLIEMNSPMINEVMSDPENAYLIKNGLGFQDIKIPGYDDRQKQLEEIQQLTTGAPVDMETPSVTIDKLLDNHAVEAEVCRTFLIGDVGRDLKNTNPLAYQNVYLHYAQHQFEVQMKMAQEAMMQSQPQQPTEGNNG